MDRHEYALDWSTTKRSLNRADNLFLQRIIDTCIVLIVDWPWSEWKTGGEKTYYPFRKDEFPSVRVESRNLAVCARGSDTLMLVNVPLLAAVKEKNNNCSSQQRHRTVTQRPYLYVCKPLPVCDLNIRHYTHSRMIWSWAGDLCRPTENLWNQKRLPAAQQGTQVTTVRSTHQRKLILVSESYPTLWYLVRRTLRYGLLSHHEFNHCNF